MLAPILVGRMLQALQAAFTHAVPGLTAQPPDIANRNAQQTETTSAQNGRPRAVYMLRGYSRTSGGENDLTHSLTRSPPLVMVTPHQESDTSYHIYTQGNEASSNKLLDLRLQRPENWWCRAEGWAGFGRLRNKKYTDI